MKKDYIRQGVVKFLKDIFKIIMNAYEEFLYGESSYNSKGNFKFSFINIKKLMFFMLFLVIRLFFRLGVVYAG